MYWDDETLCAKIVHIRNSFIYIYIYIQQRKLSGTNDRPKVNKPPTASATAAHIFCCSSVVFFFRVWKQLNTKNVTVGHVLVCYFNFHHHFYRRWDHRSRFVVKYAVNCTSKERIHRCDCLYWNVLRFSGFFLILIILTVRDVKEWIFRIFSWFQQKLGIYNIFLVSN